MRDFVRVGAGVLLAAVAGIALATTQGRSLQVPALGARGVALANPDLPRPPVQACVVSLFEGMSFDAHGDPTAMTAQPHAWHYTPPASCPGPWARVVLEADFSVTAGRQYDRTASLWLDGINLFFGTTQEPGADVAPHWHIERDLTDYAGLFRHAGDGQMILNNWVSGIYTGVIRGSARLVFYPAAKNVASVPAADDVYGLDGDHGAPAPVQDGHEALSRTFTLPRNVERAYLDVIAQSQSTDEQWYMCIDDADVAPTRDYSLGPPASGDPLEQCGGGNFRAVEVSIDGQPAGRAPVYPWTYTGGVDPHLWRPTPDVQTLNFLPYRLDLTPFAALLDDGHPHTVSVRVLGAHHFFSLAANLLVYRDHGRKVLSGKLLQNTLATARDLAPQVERSWKAAAHGGMAGHVDTTQHTDYVIAGELATSHGIVQTRVAQQSSFANRQRFLHPDAATYHQIIDLDTRVTDTVSTRVDGKTATHQRTLHYPQQVDVNKHVAPDSSFTTDIGMRQGYARRIEETRDGQSVFHSSLDDSLASHDTADFNASGTAITKSRNQHGWQDYRFSDSLGSCYARRVENRDEAVTAVVSGKGCPKGANRFDWRSRPGAL